MNYNYLIGKLSKVKLYLMLLGQNFSFQNALFALLLLFTFSFLINYFSINTTLANTNKPNNVLILEDLKGEYPLGYNLSILEDKNKNLTVEQVSSKEFAEKFVENKISVPNFGYSSSAYWIKFSVNNKSSFQKDWLLEVDFPRLNKVDFYQPASNKESFTNLNTFTRKQAGSSIAFLSREFEHRNFVFPVMLLPGEEKTFFLRVESFSTISLPLKIWSQKVFQEKDQIKLIFLGIYYGILLVLIAYNIFLFFAIKDLVFLIYVLRALIIGILQFSFDGFAAQYIWPTSTVLTNHSIQIFGYLFAVSILLLENEYLVLKENAPAWAKLNKYTIFVLLFLAIISIFTYSAFLLILLNIIGFIILTTLAVPTIICLRKKNSLAKYFFISLAISFLGALVVLLRNVNIIENSFLVHYILHFSSALQVIVLSLGLADRVRLLQKDKEEAQIAVTLKEKDAEIFQLRNVELTEANLKLKELDQIKANFTAMLVHDLKSPLTVVRSALELLASDKTIKKDNKEVISASERSVEKILSLVNEVLELYRSESQEMTLELKVIDVEVFMRELITSTNLAAKASSISVDVQMALPLPEILGDSNKLERVFSNLISNAIKFTPSGGKITLEVSSVYGTGVEIGLKFLRISITDTGEGIAAEEIPYLFEPYRQAESRKKSSGVGLGLAIVKRIVASHGGNISVQSQLGVGSCFSVLLPAINPNEETSSENKTLATFTKSGRLIPYKDSETKQNEQVIVDQPIIMNTETLVTSPSDSFSTIQDTYEQPIILLVDDDNINQLIVKKQLQQLGYKVDAAANGVAALRALKNKSYNLVLMDCNMPIMDGYETTTEIRNREAEEREKKQDFSRIPIIALTANSLSDSEKCFEVGMDDFLEKPFTLNQIKTILEKWLTKT